MKTAVIVLSIVLFISIIGNIYMSMNPNETTIVKKEMPEEEIEKIREISHICGLDPGSFEQSTLLSNLSDIKSTLWNSTRTCDATPLSKEETELLDSYLNDQPGILSKIKAQNAFITPYSMKRVIVLPVKE